MKKFLALLLVIVMMLSALVGCTGSKKPAGSPDDGNGPVDGPQDPERPGGNGGSSTVIDGIPEGLTGKDVAKLLLADTRLSSNLIDKNDGIFADGSATYRTLAAMAEESFESLTLSAPQTLDDIGVDKGLVPLGETYTELDEFCRAYEVFKSDVENIVSNANAGADMIDFVKKHVRVLDTWIKIDSREIYLHVDENSETIYQRDSERISICKRYKNEMGQDVYELYEERSFMNIRSLYIKGERYEITCKFNDQDRYDVMIADNTKGYWEVFRNTSTVDEINFPGEILHTPEFFVIKDDISYSFMHLYKTDETRLTMISADRTSEIVSELAMDGRALVTIKPAAFSGIESVTEGPNDYNATINLKNGDTINVNTYYLNGEKVSPGEAMDLFVTSVRVSHTAWGVEVELDLDVYADEGKDVREILEAQLKEWGMECKYGSTESLFERFDRAYIEGQNIIKYYRWNSYSAADGDELTLAYRKEIERFESTAAIYDGVKNAPSITVELSDAFTLSAHFADITFAKSEQIAYADGKVSVGELEIVVGDKLLFIEGEDYVVAFALRSDADGGLTHIAIENPVAVKYQGGEVRVASGALEFDLPIVAHGAYSLVAYVASSDGVRASGYAPVKFDAVSDAQLKKGDILLSATKTDDGAMSVTCAQNPDIYISIQTDENMNYAEFYEAVAFRVYEFGIISDALIEREGAGEVYAPLSGSEEIVSGGLYRTSYTVSNGENSTQGYVFINYNVVIPEGELEVAP